MIEPVPGPDLHFPGPPDGLNLISRCMKLSHLTVRARLLAGFGSLVLVAVLLSVLAISALGRSHADYEKYVNTDAVLFTLANDVLDGANARAVGARNLVLATDDAARKVEVEGIRLAHEKVGERLPHRLVERLLALGERAVEIESDEAFQAGIAGCVAGNISPAYRSGSARLNDLAESGAAPAMTRVPVKPRISRYSLIRLT